MDNRLRQAVIYELEHLSDYKARLEQLKMDLEDKGPSSDVVLGSSLPGDPTGSSAINRVELIQTINNLEIRIKRIEIAVGVLNGVYYDIINMRYLMCMGYRDSDVIDRLYMSRRNYYKLREQALIRLVNIIGHKRLLKWSAQNETNLAQI